MVDTSSVDDGDTTEQKDKAERNESGLLAWYAHTSRVWSGAVSSTLAIISIFIAVTALVRTQVLTLDLKEYLPYVALIFVMFYLISFYLIVRIGEIGIQLQFLERNIMLDVDSGSVTLLTFVKERLPRLSKLHKRYSDAEIDESINQEKTFRWFLRQSSRILAIWTLAYIIYAVLFFSFLL